MKVLILLDWKLSKETKPWLKTELEKFGYEVTLLGIPNYDIKDRTSQVGIIMLWYKYFILAKKAIKESSSNDVIISLNFVVGSMAGFLCRLLRCKRKVISLNLIAHEKGSLNSFFRKAIYNIAFGYKTFWFSVNDPQLIDYYSSLFSFPKHRIFLLPDVYGMDSEQCVYQKMDTYVFTGGEAYRDWNNFVKCAEEMPYLQFVGVARQKDFDLNIILPGNLKMYFDLSEDSFYSLLKGASIVFLPLLSLAPCGLIVIIRAALLSKPIIATRTPSIKNYIIHDETGLLVEMHDLDEMKKSIEKLFNSEKLRKYLAENLRKHVITNFSFEQNARKIDEIIKIDNRK